MQTALAGTAALNIPAPHLRGYTEPVRRTPEAKSLGSTRTLGKDEELYAEGDRAAYFYKVVSGAVRTSKLLSDGRRQIDAFHLPSDIFGLEAGDEHRFSAEAVGDAVIGAGFCSDDAIGKSFFSFVDFTT